MKYLFGVMFLTVIVNASPQGVPAMTNFTVVTAGNQAYQALPYNKDRGYLIIQNNGSSTCYVSLGASLTGTIGTQGLAIATAQNYEPQQAFVKSAVFVQCGVVPTQISFLESNF